MSAEQSIGFSVSWIARMLRTHFDASARALGLTRAQWTMMLAIDRTEGATQRTIASRLEINSVTAGRIVDRLEASGWIERRADPQDRRLKRLYLTSAAAPMLDRLGAIGTAEEQTMLRGLTEKQKNDLSRLLGLIVTNMKERDADIGEIVGGSQ